MGFSRLVDASQQAVAENEHSRVNMVHQDAVTQISEFIPIMHKRWEDAKRHLRIGSAVFTNSLVVQFDGMEMLLPSAKLPTSQPLSEQLACYATVERLVHEFGLIELEPIDASFPTMDFITIRKTFKQVGIALRSIMILLLRSQVRDPTSRVEFEYAAQVAFIAGGGVIEEGLGLDDIHWRQAWARLSLAYEKFQFVIGFHSNNSSRPKRSKRGMRASKILSWEHNCDQSCW